MRDEMESGRLIDAIEQALIDLDEAAFGKLLAESCSDGIQTWQTIDILLVPVMERIGKKWEQGELALSQLYLGGKLCERVLNALLPEPVQGAQGNSPRIGLAVLEDYHFLGKRIVHSLLRSAGFTVFDYGHASVEELVAHAKADRLEILFISTLMLHSALKTRLVCEKLKASGLTVKVMVGGAPFRFDEKLWTEIGADAMGHTASDALAYARQFREGRP